MSGSISLNRELREEYTRLFKSCTLKPDTAAEVERLVRRILDQEQRYRSVSGLTGVPWPVVAAIHTMEAGLRFDRHLHNGDSLRHRTRRVPANRPPGTPPFSWEESAVDALQYDGFSGWSDWSVPGVLFKLEGYNGWGYRKYHASVLSPYLWSLSTHYDRGKYAADGRFDPDLVSRQCGAAVLLRALQDHGLEIFADAPVEPERSTPAPYPGQLLRQGTPDSLSVRLLQSRLNELGCAGPPLIVDGDFGSRTEAAVCLFQARSQDAHGEPLEIDGLVGSLTWEALFGESALPRLQVRPAQTPLTAKVLEIARKEIGVCEEPPGSNRGPGAEKYLASVGLDGGYPWCAAFVYWCFEQAARAMDTDTPCIRTAGVLQHWNLAGREGIRRIPHLQAQADPQLVQPGMVFVIDTGDPGGGGHTGLVERVEGGRLVTIEGNTNQAGGREGIGVFRRRRRKVSQINKGFIDYSRGLG